MLANRYTSPNSSIISGAGTMYNEATTFNNNHYNKSSTGINANTNLIMSTPIKKKKYRSMMRSSSHL